VWQVCGKSRSGLTKNKPTKNGSTKPWLSPVSRQFFLYTEGVRGSSRHRPWLYDEVCDALEAL
jgi:hypothetical protein